ncbi:hypothetical protein [Desulfogranum marinum]|uniref:hypothetical protein n=1 Tax=Desulfogranum marinum TaxID=453220 RepID=UPI0019649E68|nr:hypothetical protein [Desulfogranum marinum]MBM9515227.1 hypothetical protein [Desulfogranum marinum]
MKHRKFFVLTFSVVSRVVMVSMFVLGFATAASAQPTEINTCQNITSSGSYILTDNLTASDTCLNLGGTILNVTIDLNGFTIDAPVAITTGDNMYYVAVRNGIAHGRLALYGVSRVENMIVVDYGNEGAGITTMGGIVTGNTVIGFSVGIVSSGLITGNTVNQNNSEPYGWGILAQPGSTVSNNVAVGNHVGFVVDCPSHVTGNTGYNNFEQDLLLRGQEFCKNKNNLQVANTFEKIDLD